VQDTQVLMPDRGKKIELSRTSIVLGRNGRWPLQSLRTPTTVIAKSLDGRLLSWNSGAEKIFGYTAEVLATV
jgi:PAS domain-containing protein